MLPPREWTEAYVKNLPIGEFDWLEVKGRRGLDLTLASVNESAVRETLAKAVSAFANSGGGTLIYGLANPTKSWRVDDGGVDLKVKGSGTREWLEDIIPTLVDFPLSNFNVYVIQRTNEQSEIASDRGIFIVEIGDSEHAPHQSVVDHRYYARVGGKSRPLSHRLVSDIFSRRRDPQFEMDFWFEVRERERASTFPVYPPERGNPSVDVFLKFRATNVGRVYAKYVNTLVYLPEPIAKKVDWQSGRVSHVGGEDYFLVSERNVRRDLLDYEAFKGPRYGPSWFDPILPGRSHTWEWHVGEMPVQGASAGKEILWKIYADNSGPSQGKILLSEIEVK